MGKNKVRHILHGVLDCLPIILIPIFMIYSQNHEINDNTLQVEQNKIVDFNQMLTPNITQDISDNSNSDWIYLYNDLQLFANQIYIVRWQQIGTLTSNIRNTPLLQYTGNYISYSQNQNNDLVGGWYEWYFNAPVTDFYRFAYWVHTSVGTAEVKNFNLYNLSQMFGIGDEPTKQEFDLYFPYQYYDYTLSTEMAIVDYTITYDDTDIMSQSFYCLYNAVDKYFNMGNVFGMKNLYSWFEVNIFGGTASPSIYIVWNIVLYEFIMDLLFLLYGLFMFFIDLCKRLMEKPLNSIK